MLIQFSKIFYKNLQDVNQLVQQDTISNAAGKFQQQQQQQQQQKCPSGTRDLKHQKEAFTSLCSCHRTVHDASASSTWGEAVVLLEIPDKQRK